MLNFRESDDSDKYHIPSYFCFSSILHLEFDTFITLSSYNYIGSVCSATGESMCI